MAYKGKDADGNPLYLTDTGNSGVDAANAKVPVNSREVPKVAKMTAVAINAASSGDNTLVSGTALQTIRVHRLFLVVAAAVNLKFKDGAGSDFHPALPLQAYASLAFDFDGEPYFITTSGNGLILNLSAAVQVSGMLYYTKST